MQDLALELPTKTEIIWMHDELPTKTEIIYECYLKSNGQEIDYTLNLSILDADGNACPIYCHDSNGNAVVKEGPFSVKLDLVKIEPKIEDSVWNSLWISAEIVTDMTGVIIDKNGQPILTDYDLKNGDLLSKDSPTIFTENNYNSRIVVVVSLVKIIDSVPVVPVVWDNSDCEYATITYTRIRRSEIKTSLMLHIVKNDKNFKEIARNILYPTQDSASDSNSDKDSDSNQDKDSDSNQDKDSDSNQDKDSDSNQDKDSDKDSDSEDAEDMKDDVEDAEDMKDDVEDAEDADDAEDAEDIEDDYDDNEDKDMEDEDPKP